MTPADEVAKQVIVDEMLPLLLPEKCPICEAKVYLTEVSCWETDTGKIEQISCDCETEPEIDSDEWWTWHREHYSMPYVYWLPYEIRALEWLNARYRMEIEA